MKKQSEAYTAHPGGHWHCTISIYTSIAVCCSMVQYCTPLCPCLPCAVRQKKSVKEEFANREDCLYLRLTDCSTDQVVEHFRPGRKLALKGAWVVGHWWVGGLGV